MSATQTKYELLKDDTISRCVLSYKLDILVHYFGVKSSVNLQFHSSVIYYLPLSNDIVLLFTLFTIEPQEFEIFELLYTLLSTTITSSLS